MLLGSSAAWAQEADEEPAAKRADLDERAIVVTGRRGSAVTDVAPIAEYDADAVAAMGATTMADVLRTVRGTAQSADGSDPIYLLNAQRVSSPQEIFSLPPEVLEKIEVLPEQSALKFGYPPTRRVLNFITKRRFRQVEVRASVATLTRGGSTTEKGNAALTRLRDDGRLTLGLEYRRTDPLVQSDREVEPDPDVPFDALGNVTGIGGGEIDPALSVAAGGVVTIAPVPAAGADRAALPAYAAGANRPRLFDIGPYRTMLPRNDALKAEAVIADRLGDTLAGSLSLSAEQSRDRSLAGPATARLIVPRGNPFSPFTGPIVLNRYLIETDPLAQTQTTTTLHAGVTLRGVLAGWRWDFTGVLDHRQVGGVTERQIDPAAANAAIATGIDPFRPLDAALLAARLSDRLRTRTRTAGAKVMVSNMPLYLPAGGVTVTATAEAEWMDTASSSQGANTSNLQLGRARVEGGLAVDIPLASASEHVLPFLGKLSANASANIRDVGGFGVLHDTTYGLAWTSLLGLQVLATARHSSAAPDMTRMAAPVVRLVNVPVFDLINARTELVTVTQGGNPALAAERRDSRSLTLNFKPFQAREWRLALTYDATDIHDQTGTVYAITPQTQAILPDLFARDAAGRLIAVAYQPTNFALERQRTLSLTLNFSGRIGKLPPPGPGAGVRIVPSYFGGIGPTLKLSDRLQLRPGAPELDLLDGDTITGTGMSRVQGYFVGGISYNGYGGQIDGTYSAPFRMRGAEGLHFSPYFRLNLGAFAPLNRLLPGQDWAKGMQLRLDVSNLTDYRQRVRDTNGATPFRYQSDFLDPSGRTVTLTLRKLF